MIAFFEEVSVGDVTELGSHTFTREEIIAFAGRYDPQPFHVDEAAAKDSLFGGLCASGWHTGCIWLRLLIQHRQRRIAEMIAAGETPPRFGPSPGVRDLRWLKPVYPGDTISYRSTVIGKKDTKSHPEWGLMISRHEGFNQDGEPVIGLQGSVLVERREPAHLPISNARP